jgi:hypothetical protein
VAHEEGNLNDLRAILGNDVAILIQDKLDGFDLGNQGGGQN